MQTLDHNLSILLPRDSLDSQLGAHLLELNDFIHFLKKEFCGNSDDQSKVSLEFRCRTCQDHLTLQKNPITSLEKFYNDRFKKVLWKFGESRQSESGLPNEAFQDLLIFQGDLTEKYFEYQNL